MVLTLLAIAVLGQEKLTFGKLHSRAEFFRAEKEIKEGWTKRKVLDKLGPPDAKEFDEDQDDLETWKYGTSPSNEFPTLGTLLFESGKVRNEPFFSSDVEPPSASDIPERQLRDILRKIYRRPDYLVQLTDGLDDHRNDPLRIVQVANLLIPLGRERAISVLREFCRVNPHRFSQEWMFWLVRAVFVPKDQTYTFRPPALGMYDLPKDLNEWPTFPILVVDRLPINFYGGASLKGQAEIFAIGGDSINWKIRPEKFVPPDDPFPLYSKAMEFCKGKYSSWKSDYLVQSEILRLVRTAYKKSAILHVGDDKATDFEGFHREFLKLRCHWDPKLNIYVRGDGTFDQDHIQNYPIQTYQFPSSAEVKVRIKIERRNGDEVWTRFRCEEKEGAPTGMAIIVIRDAKTQRELDWSPVNVNYERYPWPAPWKEMLKEKPHKGRADRFMDWRHPKIGTGVPIQIELHYGSKVYISPVFNP